MIEEKNEFVEEINKKVNDIKNRSLIEIYVEIYDILYKKYGKNTLLFMEVGSFYETYCPFEEGVLFNNIKEISNIIDVQLTRRNTKIKEIDLKNPYLLGFNNVSKNKYIQKLKDTNKFTIAIISQNGNAKEKNVSRYLEQIVSNGTDIEQKNIEENYLVSLNIDKIEENYLVGYSYIDVTTGKNVIGEFYSSQEDNNLALDSIIDLLLNYNTAKILINLENKNIDEKFIINYLELKDNFIIKKEKRKIEYQNNLLNKIFKIESFVSAIEDLNLTRLPLATSSYVFLLEYIIDFEIKLLDNLERPLIYNDNKKLYIGNNGLEQLNVISNDNSNNLLNLLNKCGTAFGKRLFKERLLNPISDKKELERRYNLIDNYKENYKEILFSLQNISDLEKIIRKISINKLQPFELANFYYSLEEIYKNKDLFIPETDKNIHFIKDCINETKRYFLISDCSRFNLDTISQNLIKKGNFDNLDTLIEERDKLTSQIYKIKEKIDELFNIKDFITISYNETLGFSFLISKTRYKTLEEKKDTLFFNLINEKIFLSDFKIDKRTSNVKITHEKIKEISNKYLLTQNKIIDINKNFFKKKILNIYEKFLNFLKELTLHIADIDIAAANAKNAILFNYNKPIIIENNKQKIKAIELRHPIIERILENNKFIANDIYIGNINEQIKENLEIDTDYINGILLFGLNSAGKSSIQKALGLTVIMAQSGMFVPAKNFEFTLYSSLFTRITSKDNPDRGLSTFAVEMLELKNILTRGNEKSLVLGDEICHGTETVSGVSIVAAAIQLLTKRNINFIFATHLHQLVELEEINNLKEVIKLHLSVEKKDNIIIYNRKLKPGSGSSIYGLEFAKSLNMNKEFIYFADNILKKIDKIQKTEMEELKNEANKVNKYNSNIFETRCAICNEKVEDIHHIDEQNQADKNNRIEGIHKNHKSNLVPLCKKHHIMLHSGDYYSKLGNNTELMKYIPTSTGIKLWIHPLIVEDWKIDLEKNKNLISF